MLGQWRSQAKLQRCDSKPRKYVGSGGERRGDLQCRLVLRLWSQESPGSESQLCHFPAV